MHDVICSPIVKTLWPAGGRGSITGQGTEIHAMWWAKKKKKKRRKVSFRDLSNLKKKKTKKKTTSCEKD